MSDWVMRRWSRLASAQAALAVAIVTVGVPATITALYDLRFYSTVDPSGSLAKKQAGDTLAALEQETPHSAAEGRDLAFALLAHGNDPDLSGAAQTRVVERAVRGFREYLARVPGDGQAWAGLASGQIRLRDPGRGAEALRMSILMAPWSDTLVQWRCGMAIDLFRALNAEERELMKGQFRVAAQRSAADLVHTVLQRNGTRVARLFLASSPDELIKFETELAKRH